MSKCFADYKCGQAMQTYKEEMISSLNQLAELVSTDLINYKRLSMEALLTVQVHNRDIISSLIQSDITDRSDFEWLRWVGGGFQCLRAPCHECHCYLLH